MKSGCVVRIVDKQLAGGETTIEIDGITLQVKAYSVSRIVGGLCEVTFTIFANSATVEHEGPP